MKLKLDENFAPRLVEVFIEHGFDTHSVLSEDLSGTSDDHLFAVCRHEGRVLITFDTDFCNILRYPPDNTPGIIVVRPNRPLNLAIIRSYAEKIISLLANRNPENALWVLEPDRLRIRK